MKTIWLLLLGVGMIGATQVVTSTIPSEINARGNGGRWGNVASTAGH